MSCWCVTRVHKKMRFIHPYPTQLWCIYGSHGGSRFSGKRVVRGIRGREWLLVYVQTRGNLSFWEAGRRCSGKLWTGFIPPTFPRWCLWDVDSARSSSFCCVIVFPESSAAVRRIAGWFLTDPVRLSSFIYSNTVFSRQMGHQSRSDLLRRDSCLVSGYSQERNKNLMALSRVRIIPVCTYELLLRGEMVSSICTSWCYRTWSQTRYLENGWIRGGWPIFNIELR